MTGRVRPRLILAATSDESLIFLEGFPGYLDGKGWDVHVVSSPGPRLDALAAAPGVTAHALPMRRNPAPLADLRAAWAWWRLLGQIRPDAILAGTPKVSLLSLVAARLRRVPTRVYHVLGLRLESAVGATRAVLRAMEVVTARSATHVLAVSPSLADAVAREGIARRGRVDVLGAGSSNGVDVSRFSPSEVAVRRAAARAAIDLEDRDVLVGFIGRLNADKGLDTLVAALRRLADLDHLKVIIVGEVDTTNASDTNELAQDRRVHLVGYSSDTREWYAAMDIVCLPTRREGMPNVMLEASSCGLPVVTTDATGAVDSVVDGVTGLIVPVGDDRALADALRSLAADSARRALLGRAGRERAVAAFARSDVWAAHDEYLRARAGTR